MCTKTKALGITLLCGRTSEYHDQGSLYAYKIQDTLHVYDS